MVRLAIDKRTTRFQHMGRKPPHGEISEEGCHLGKGPTRLILATM